MKQPMNRSLTRTLGLSLAPLAIGCGHIKILDPAVVQAASSVGEASAALLDSQGQARAEVEGSALEVESALVELALAHDSWLTEPGALTRLDAVPSPEQHLKWTDGRLRGGMRLDDGGVLASTLRFSGGRTENVDTSGGLDGICQGAEVTGSGDGVWCPPFADRFIFVDRPVVVDGQPMSIQLEADYGLRLDGRGCAAGGQVDLTYVLTPDNEQPIRGGFVSAQFHGCGNPKAATREP